MLPFNSGEIYSMNPGEQNQNNFGQPGPIMSSPNDATPSPAPAPISSGQPSANTSRFFGGASRYKGPRTRSASNPEYFSQPAPTPGPIAMSEPLPQYKERKSKAPIFIGIGAIAVIGIIVAAVILLPGIANGGGASEEEIADLTNLMKEYGESAIFYDSEIRYEPRLATPSDNTKGHEDYKKQLTTNLEGVHALREQLDKYNNTKAIIKDGSDEELDADEKIKELKKILDERISMYEKYAEVMTAYSDIYISSGSTESIKAFESATGTNGKKALDKLSKYFNAKNRLNKIFVNNTCTTTMDECVSVYNTMTEAKNSIENDKDFSAVANEIANKKLPDSDVMTLVNQLKVAQKKGEDKTEEVKQ